MIQPKELFSRVAVKKNVIGFSDNILHGVYDKIQQKKMDTVVIYVTKKLPLSQLAKEDIVPRYFKGIFQDPVRHKIKELGEIVALDVPVEPLEPIYDIKSDSGMPDRIVRNDPVTLGLSVAHRSITAGSLGMLFVEDSSGKLVWGSNAHVLTPDATISPEEIEEKRIHQPGSYHQEPTEDTEVGTYHWHKQIVGAASECPIAGYLCKALNTLSTMFKRNTKIKAVSTEGANKIDFACYTPTVPHENILPDEMEKPGPFIGLLFAGSETAGIICKNANIKAEGYTATDEVIEVKEGDNVFGSSFWGDYETVVEDVNLSVQVNYGNCTAMFEDMILVKNDNIIKGGWSGSGWHKVV